MTVTNFKGADFLVNRNRKTNSKLQKSLEKLASGYQVNRAADDAAGLAAFLMDDVAVGLVRTQS